ncbi:MAG: acetyl-CoA C-acetyltransferase [Acidimicrobiia bacterium]|nr:acetyl-CoA C-acetyltransferase [Acidimicrobiia bacterium]
MPEAVIVSTARTPIGRAFKGSLRELRSDNTAALVVQAALDKVPELDRTEIEDLVLGCGLPGGEQGYNMARVVAVLAGLDEVPGTTVNRYCASSLQAIRIAAHAVRAGEGDVFVAAGSEFVSRFVKGSSDGLPDTQNHRFDDARARSAERAQGGAAAWEPPAGLPDIYIEMGQTAENVVQLKKVSRQSMDEFACLSQNRAVASQERGFFEREITPVETPEGIASTDDGPRPGTTVEKLASLQPAFRPDGEVTAGNACPLNDGSAAVVVMSDTRAQELGVKPLARVVASAVSGLNPEIMGLGPIEAVRKALARAGMTIGDVDIVELNEAFAAQVVPCAEELGIDWDKLNPNGGAIALGHPFGMTGARIMTTLLNGLEDADKTIGLETMCVGGGQGMAMVVERL